MIRKETMIGAAIRYFSTKPKPKMKPIELKTPPEQTQTITRAIFDIVKEHDPLTIAKTWEKVQEVGLRGLSSKRHMKIVLRWMTERQKLRLICNHVGPHKQFLYTCWFSKSNFKETAVIAQVSISPNPLPHDPCKQLVFEFGPIILTNAEQFLERTDICTLLHACTPSREEGLQVLKADS